MAPLVSFRRFLPHAWRSSKRIAIAAILAGAVVIVAWLGTESSKSQSVAAQNAPKGGGKRSFPQLEVSPANTDLGTVPPASQLRTEFRIFNPNSEAVVVERVETSCECFKPLTLPWRFAPSQNKTAIFEIDLREEPRFCGSLQMNAIGYSADNSIALAVSVSLEVRKNKSTD